MSDIPFHALVGLDAAQQALLLLAVEPRLRGLVVAAGAGTGKSTLARGMRQLRGAETIPFVEIPPGVDTANLYGGLNLEATLQRGELVLQPGVLARAHGGVAYVDGLNLLTDTNSNLLLSVLDQAVIQLEREGVSWRMPAEINLIGSYDPAEGLPRRHLLDRLGLWVTLPAQYDAGERTAVIQRNLHDQLDSWGEDLHFLQGLVATARETLPAIQITEQQVRLLAQLALRYGVEGQRVDLFAVRAACAAAALALSPVVEDEHLALAVRLVIVPRATQIPEQTSEPQPPPPPPPPDPDPPDEGEPESDAAQLPEQLALPPEQILEALAAELPVELESLPFQNLRRGRSGSRGSTEGKRGRHIRSIPGNPRQARIDIVSTLRAAAPWQPARRQARGLVPEQGRGQRPLLEMSDIRVKQYRSKAGALFCFAVDASGSMALHRMRQAKGAVNALLQKAYVNRDKVALISFRGEEAELLMPPTQSVERARRALDLLPTGGGTPLASALLLAADVAEQARSRGILQTVLILLTDGRANVALHQEGSVQTELQRLGRHLSEAPLQIIVLDTQRSYLSRGEARQLSEWVGGLYAYLPNASGEQIADLAAQVAGGR
ncbi:MAG: magnesium chelatase ATPase subunit D [Anaerolineales bacterium]|nr:magnesium chelatase ATPase subunit D [Anaerolineales bacterium]